MTDFTIEHVYLIPQVKRMEEFRRQTDPAFAAANPAAPPRPDSPDLAELKRTVAEGKVPPFEQVWKAVYSKMGMSEKEARRAYAAQSADLKLNQSKV